MFEGIISYNHVPSPLTLPSHPTLPNQPTESPQPSDTPKPAGITDSSQLTRTSRPSDIPQSTDTPGARTFHSRPMCPEHPYSSRCCPTIPRSKNTLCNGGGRASKQHALGILRRGDGRELVRTLGPCLRRESVFVIAIRTGRPCPAKHPSDL